MGHGRVTLTRLAWGLRIGPRWEAAVTDTDGDVERVDVTTKRFARVSITVAALAAAYLAAFLLRFEFSIPPGFVETLVVTLPVVVVLKYGLLGIMRANRHSWQHTSLDDAVAVAMAMFAAAALLLGVRLLLGELFPASDVAAVFLIPIGVIGIDLALSVLGLTGLRAVRRLVVERQQQRRLGAVAAQRRRRVLLVGAGRVGSLVVREVAGRPDLRIQLVGFIDDDPGLQRQVVNGLEVLGTTDDLADLIRENDVDEVIITISNIDGATVRRLSDTSREVGAKTSIVPGMHEIVGGQVSISRLRPVAVEDLLGRDAVELDVSSIREYVADRVVLVTGAGGSIGSELSRQLAAFGPSRLVLAEQAENALWEIHRDLEASTPDVELIPAIADVCDRERIEQLFVEHHPAVVFHAAAHKHVPMMETNPSEAVKNNVFGTKVVADLALAYGTERFVLVSTDKAVNPTSIMGMTKRLAERYVRNLAVDHDRCFVSVRFGNVLGSAGSVVPIFEEQIRRGGPITITDPDMRRYFMTIPEASQLVIQAAALGDGGEIFVLDMGEPVRIVDLAQDLIRLSGLQPEVDIAIRYTGVRPGEKLYEELSLHAENASTTKHPKIFTGTSQDPRWSSVDADLRALRELARNGDDEVVRQHLIELIPELKDRPDAAEADVEAPVTPELSRASQSRRV